MHDDMSEVNGPSFVHACLLKRMRLRGASQANSHDLCLSSYPVLPCGVIEEIVMLELYQFEGCEYSAQVRLKMSEWEIDYILRNVSRDTSKRPLLKRISGRNETPTLVDSARDVILVADERDIIRYVRK